MILPRGELAAFDPLAASAEAPIRPERVIASLQRVLPEEGQVKLRARLAGFGLGADQAGTEVRKLSGSGVDHSFECVGNVNLMRQAVDMVGPGGQTIILGVAPMDHEVSFQPTTIYQDKSIMGCRYGSTRPAADIPALIDLYLDGRLLLDELVTTTYDLSELDHAFEDMEAGKLARGVLSM